MIFLNKVVSLLFHFYIRPKSHFLKPSLCSRHRQSCTNLNCIYLKWRYCVEAPWQSLVRHLKVRAAFLKAHLLLKHSEFQIKEYNESILPSLRSHALYANFHILHISLRVCFPFYKSSQSCEIMKGLVVR